MFTAYQLRKLVQNRQFENLLFCSTEILKTMANGNHSEECRCHCTAELFVRHILNRKSVPDSLLDELLIDGERTEAEAFFNGDFINSREGLDHPLWEGTNSFSIRCEILVRERLSVLFDEKKTSGFIPVYVSGKEKRNAYFIPFHLEKSTNSPSVMDLGGNQILPWQGYYSTIPGISCCCVLHCWQDSLPYPLSGKSFMLSVYIASEREKGNLPDYDRFRLLSTGAIDKDHLTEVDTDEKEQAAANMFSDACMLYPESGSTSHGRSGNIPLPITLPLEQINEIIRKEIEAKSLDFPDFTYAMKRLKRLESETRHENYSRWEFLLARLGNNMRSINRYQSPEGYLLCQMLHSAIYCHMGQTDQALAWNQRAKDFARANGFEKQLCRLGIEELVEFQDLEDFYTVKVLSSQIASEVEKLKDDDLKMRYSGTMGQACAYGFLAGIEGFTERGKEEALRYFQTAAECAFRLGSMDDAAQDLNYIHLWHALFEPGTPEENQTAKEAADHIRLQIKNNESRKKHEYFLRRQRAFSLYRSCLLNKELQSFDSVRSLRLPKNSAEGWLFAVTNKYIAAILAACGHTQEAKEYFDEALEVLTPNSRHNIIDFIRMTVLAEGYHSLHLLEYKDAALKALSVFPETPSSQKWKSYLETGKNYPALQYWY